MVLVLETIAVPDGSMDTSASQPCVALFKGKLDAIAFGGDEKTWQAILHMGDEGVWCA